MTQDRRRIRALVASLTGVLSLVGWGIILSYYRTGKVHYIALVAIAVTVATMVVLLRAYAAKTDSEETFVALSLLSLLLGIIAMVIVSL